MPDPIITPQRNGCSLAKSKPESRTASIPATKANWVNRSIRLTSFLSI